MQEVLKFFQTALDVEDDEPGHALIALAGEVNPQRRQVMKVTDKNPIQLDAYTQQLQQSAKRLQNPQQETGPSNVPKDKVDLSSAAREIQQISHEAGDVGVVNDEKVQKIKMEIEKGTYKVVGAQVAGDMLKESLENDFIMNKINTKA